MVLSIVYIFILALVYVPEVADMELATIEVVKDRSQVIVDFDIHGHEETG